MINNKLPTVLDAGGVAPEKGVLVPLHGPGTSMTLTWEQLADELRQVSWPETADALQAVADVAEAEPHLWTPGRGDLVRDNTGVKYRLEYLTHEGIWHLANVITHACRRVTPPALVRHYTLIEPDVEERVTRIDDANSDTGSTEDDFQVGDQVSVGEMFGVIDSIDCEAQTAVIRWREEWAPLSFPVPFDAIIGIAGAPNEFDPDPLHHGDYPALTRIGDISDAEDRKADWTPEEGMLIERISDGECIRLDQHQGIEWHGRHISGVEARIGCRALALYYRPRVLRVGDVIEKTVCPDGSVYETAISTSIVSIKDGWVHVSNSSAYSFGYVLYVEGLGPVPWPVNHA